MGKVVWMILMLTVAGCGQVFANECDKYVALGDKAINLAHKAGSAYQANGYYREAESYYTKASKSNDCRNMKSVSGKLRSAQSKAGRGARAQDWKKQAKLMEINRQAKQYEFEADRYYLRKDWKEAAASFNEAAKLWIELAHKSDGKFKKRYEELAAKARADAEKAFAKTKKKPMRIGGVKLPGS